MTEKNYVLNVKTPVGTIITVRGDSAQELNHNIGQFVDLGLDAAVHILEGVVLGTAPSNPVAVVQATFPGAQVISQTPTAPVVPQAVPATGGAPMCKHGQMQWVDGAKFGKSWKGYFCPQPKDATDKCAPQFQKG